MNVILNLCVFSAEKEGDLKSKNASFSSLFLQDFFFHFIFHLSKIICILLLEAKFNVIYTDPISLLLCLARVNNYYKLLLSKMSKICQSLRIVLRVSLRNL